MSCRPSRFACFLFVVSFLACAYPSIASAGCDPQTTMDAFCITKACDTIGSTVMDKDKKNIIACLYKSDGSGTKLWKAMTTADTTASGIIGPCHAVAANGYTNVVTVDTLPAGTTAASIAVLQTIYAPAGGPKAQTLTCKSGYVRSGCAARKMVSGNVVQHASFIPNGCYLPAEETMNDAAEVTYSIGSALQAVCCKSN